MSFQLLGVIRFARVGINASTGTEYISPAILPRRHGKVANHRHNANMASGLAQVWARGAPSVPFPFELEPNTGNRSKKKKPGGAGLPGDGCVIF